MPRISSVCHLAFISLAATVTTGCGNSAVANAGSSESEGGSGDGASASAGSSIGPSDSTGVESTTSAGSTSESSSSDADNTSTTTTDGTETTGGTGTDSGGEVETPCKPSGVPIALLPEVEIELPGVHPWVGYTGDFDGDGNLDIVTLDRDGDAVALSRGDGAGGFSPQTPVVVPDFPKYGVVADFDNDGRDDIVVSSRNGSTVSFLAGGNVLAPPIDAMTGLAPGFVTAGDLDGDGELDLAVVNVSSSFPAAGFALGDGAGGFGEVVWGEEYPYPHEMAYVLIGDYAGDEHADIVVVTSEMFRSYTGDGALGFTEIATLDVGLEEETTSVIADLDHDGETDLWHLVSGAPNLIAWGTGPGAFSTPVNFGPDAGSAGDLNNDGCYDLVGNSGGNSLSLARNEGDRTFTTEDPLPLNCSAEHSVVGDFDGNGWNDVVVIKGGSCNGLGVYLNGG